MTKIFRTAVFNLLLVFTFSPFVQAATAQELLIQYADMAKISVNMFSIERGKTLYFTHVKDWSCASCHTENPKNQGKHIVTNRVIEPLSPKNNINRFSNFNKNEKWFTRNCKEVIGRECTPTEKGDFISYVLSIN